MEISIHWTFVTYKYSLDEFRQLLYNIDDKCRYCVYQLEWDINNCKSYINGYIILDTLKSVTVMQNLLGDPHVYLARAIGHPSRFRALCTNVSYRIPGTDCVEFKNYTGMRGARKYGYFKSAAEIFNILRAVRD